jgi:hypothetical protein
MRALASLLAWALLATQLSACGTIGEATSKGAVIGGYEGYQELKARHGEMALGNVLADPAFRDAARDLTKAAVAGAGEGYDEAQFDKKADTLVRAMLVAAREESNEAVGQLLTEQGPRLQLIVRQTLSTSIKNAGSELRQTAATDGAAAVEAIMDAAIESLVRELGPENTGAMTTAVSSLTKGAGAGLVAGLREELARPETQVAVAELTKSAAEGAREGLLSQNGESKAIWTTAAMLLGVLFLLSVVALVFYIRRSVMSGRALTVVAQQINKEAELGQAPIGDVKKRISERAERAGVEAYLSAFLKDRGM